MVGVSFYLGGCAFFRIENFCGECNFFLENLQRLVRCRPETAISRQFPINIGSRLDNQIYS